MPDFRGGDPGAPADQDLGAPVRPRVQADP